MTTPMKPAGTVRAFIAFDLPRRVREEIREIQQVLKRERFSIKWVAPDSIHLTVKFLGDTPPEQMDGVQSAMAGAVEGVSLIRLQAAGTGVFPGISRPRVVWVGVRGETDRLADVQKDLDTRLADIGFPPGNRPFKGHLTMGRIKGNVDGKRLFEALQQVSESFDSEPFIADALTLFKSDLKPTGAVYTVIHRTPLGDI